MNYIRFEKKRTNINVYFGCVNGIDWKFIEKIQSMKDTHGFKYEPNKKIWYIQFRIGDFHPVKDNINTYYELLEHVDDSYRDKFLNFLKAKNKEKYEEQRKLSEESKRFIENYNRKISIYPFLYKHQQNNIMRMSKTRNLILADEMGLGKTKTGIVFSEIHDFKKVLIICPATLKFNWKNEIKEINKYSEICVFPADDYNNNTKYFIINYDILSDHFDVVKKGKNIESIKYKPDSFLNKIKFDVLFIDEAHYIKNDSARSIFTLKISENINRIIPITGTPMKSRTRDIWNLLVAIEHPLSYDGFFKFGMKYCNATKTRFGWDFSGSSNSQELHYHISPYMIRNLKKDCLDLPDKITNKTYVEFDDEYQKKYDNAFDDYIEFLEKEKYSNMNAVYKHIKMDNIKYAEHLVKLNLLKQICSEYKIKFIINRIKELLDEDEDRKIIIFSQYSNTINTIHEKFKNISVKLDGQTVLNKRQKAVESFQNNPKIKLFVGNIYAGGVGITLTKSDYIIKADLVWTPADHFQAEDRSHRIGQEKNVYIDYFIVKNSIEEDIFELIKEKMKIISTVIDNKKMEEEYKNSSILNEIVEKLRYESRKK